MQSAAPPEIYWLTLTALLTTVLWLPYIVNQILRMGLWAALSNSDSNAVVRSPWALRAAAAHRNGVENLAVFAPLAIAVQLLNVGTATTAMACMIYFIARIAHYLVYILGIPVVRTLVFAVGVGCQLVLVAAILGW